MIVTSINSFISIDIGRTSESVYDARELNKGKHTYERIFNDKLKRIIETSINSFISIDIGRTSESVTMLGS